MKKLQEQNNSALGNFQNRDNMRGLPFYGAKGDFNFTVGRSQFTPGVSIKQLPLSDMSRHGDPGIGEFDQNINKIKFHYQPGDLIRGILVNSQLKSNNGKVVIGKLKNVKVDRRNHTIRVYIVEPKTGKVQEIYVDTMERIFESVNRALTFSQFLRS